MLLQEHQNAQQHGEDNAVQEGAAEDAGFLPFQVTDRHTGGDILWRDHLGEDPARRVGSRHQDRA